MLQRLIPLLALPLLSSCGHSSSPPASVPTNSSEPVAFATGDSAPPASLSEKAPDATRTNGSPSESGRPFAATHSPASADKATEHDALPAALSLSKVHAEGHHYVIDGRSPAVLSPGGRGELTFTLVAKDGYHVNEKYPYKLSVRAEPDNLATFEQGTISVLQASKNKKEGSMVAHFSAKSSGKGSLIGTMSLSVCTSKECVTDKLELAVPIGVQ